jgi:hypothetical protein
MGGCTYATHDLDHNPDQLENTEFDQEQEQEHDPAITASYLCESACRAVAAKRRLV